jgi:hypothetical protein
MESQMKQMNQKIIFALVAGAFAVPAFAQVPNSDMFPNAKAGECYARVFTPPQYSTSTTQVIAREAGKQVAVIPARYATEPETRTLRAASKRLEVIPATYETVTEEVVVRAASKRIEVVRPAIYENVTETVVVREAYTTWKPGQSTFVQRTGGGRVLKESTAADGGIMCLVEVPAQTKTITKRVMKSPPETREIEIPAVTRSVAKTVMKTPPTTREIEIPAVMGSVPVTKEVEPARTVETEIPAQYQTVTSTKQVSEGRNEWRSILCETNATPGKIRELQTALQAKGHYRGPIDGIVASETMTGVNSFQRANNLPVDPYINMQTVTALGVAAK